MPFKKFDFSLCYANGYIFVIGGKQSVDDVVNTCEMYNVKDNYWKSMAPCKQKRYASTAIGTKSGHIFLFGGRSQFQNQMINQIEEYTVKTDTWKIVSIRGEIP